MLLATVCQTLIRDGALTLIDADGRSHRFGRASRPADVVVRLHDRALHHRLLTRTSVALGEAYADGTLTVERGGIYDLLDLCAKNLDRWEAHPLCRAQRVVDRALAFARRGEAPRVDHGGVLADACLDWDRQDTSAYFSDPRMTLEEAQQAKKHHLASKLLLRPGHRVLDVGCGWGGLALHLADAEHVDVTGITLSAEQLAVARRRALEAELARRVTFHQRDLSDEPGRYDRVVSAGLLEHVGARGYAAFFGKIRDVLAEDGVAVVQALGRAGAISADSAWVERHLFPGAHVPALSEVLPAIERAGLWVTDVEVLRLHHAETLRHWRRRLVASWEHVAVHHDQRACRRWEYYLALGEAAARRGGLMAFQIQLARSLDAVPLTRDYLYERTQSSELRLGLAA